MAALVSYCEAFGVDAAVGVTGGKFLHSLRISFFLLEFNRTCIRLPGALLGASFPRPEHAESQKTTPVQRLDACGRIGRILMNRSGRPRNSVPATTRRGRNPNQSSMKMTRFAQTPCPVGASSRCITSNGVATSD